MSLTLLPVLTRADVERIHERSLDLLERVGIVYNTPRALEVLAQAGCPVDYERLWAALPREVVEWALTQAPRVVRLCARDPARDVVLDGRRSHHTVDSQGTQVVDLETGAVRVSTADDLARGFLFADALDRVEIANVMVAATDVPAHVRPIRQFALGFTHTSKHVRCGVLDPRHIPYITDIARAATGGADFRPVFSAVYCTVSPLMHDGLNVEAAIELAGLGVPMLLHPMPLAGGTSPVAPAGSALLHNVEVLSALTLFQLLNPGTPLIYAAGAAQLDMLTGQYRINPLEHRLKLALREMARFYNLPVNIGGLSSSSFQLDALYGYEATTTCLLAYLTGADEVYSIGLLGSAQILSLEKMVLDNHLARELETMVQPVVVDEERLQAEVIERVGIGGHYLSQPETRAFTRREYTPVWPPVGKDMLDLVREEALQILRTHQPPPLPDGAAARIEAIVARADRELA